MNELKREVAANIVKKLYDPFSWVDSKCLKIAGPLRENTLLLTITFPEVQGAHLIFPGSMKNFLDHGTGRTIIQMLNNFASF